MPDDPQSAILILLTDLVARTKRIEAALPEKAPGVTPPSTEPPTGIYAFKRPPVGTPPYGLGLRMATADGAEMVKRALHHVNWRGAIRLDGAAADAAWAEIYAIQNGDPEVVKVYAECGADPEMIGVALLLGLIEPIRWDSTYFGVYVEHRRKLVGVTPTSWLENELAIAAGGAAPGTSNPAPDTEAP